MQLTSRQSAFLEKLFDIHYRHRLEPIHYTVVAQALGVANSTAYEMLRLLEKKGYLTSEYRLGSEHSGPGRSQVLFRPTWKTLRMFRHLFGEDAREKDWSLVKGRVLERLSAGAFPDDDRLLDELVAAIPESADRASYCARVVAASLLSIKSQFLERLHELSTLRMMAGRSATSFEALNLLPGFALGVCWSSRRNPAWMVRLARCVSRYQTYLQQMDEETRQRLMRFSGELLDALQVSSDQA